MSPASISLKESCRLFKQAIKCAAILLYRSDYQADVC